MKILAWKQHQPGAGLLVWKARRFEPSIKGTLNRGSTLLLKMAISEPHGQNDGSIETAWCYLLGPERSVAIRRQECYLMWARLARLLSLLSRNRGSILPQFAETSPACHGLQATCLAWQPSRKESPQHREQAQSFAAARLSARRNRLGTRPILERGSLPFRA